jgi:hypothetical protein
MISGVIAAVDPDAQSFVVDRGRTDDDPSDDVTLSWTDDTRIVPPDAELTVGVKVRALAMAVDTDAQLTAELIVLPPTRSEDPRPEPKPEHHVRACGTIASLPDGSLMGEWVLDAGEVGEVHVIVNGDTKIVPPNLGPQVGMMVCVKGTETDAGLVAQQIQLRPDGDDDDDHGGDHAAHFELRGTVDGSSLPAELMGTWVLVLQIPGRDAPQPVTVQPDTEIKGQLAAGAEVVVVGHIMATDAGDLLVAERIQVVGHAAGRGDDHRSRSLHGTVEAVSDTSWTIAAEDGSVDVAVNSHTRIVGLASGEDPVGHVAHVVAMTDADGHLVARLIRIEH